jgi:hypothetical protein
MSARRAIDFAQDEPGAFSRPDLNVVGPIFARVYAMPEFEELREAEPHIEFLMRNEPKRKHARWEVGTAYCKPTANGELSGMFEWLLEQYFGGYPDFIIALDSMYWADASPLDREILVFHELSHCVHARDALGNLRFTKEGAPIFGLLGHDLEEFNQVVRRYGAHSPQVINFVEAVTDGEANPIKGRPLRVVTDR